jgi:hypothetical protein
VNGKLLAGEKASKVSVGGSVVNARAVDINGPGRASCLWRSQQQNLRRLR